LCHIYPTVAKILTTFIVVAFSFLTQKHFTFKAEPVAEFVEIEDEVLLKKEDEKKEVSM
jgi:putative flippase GtrA